MFSFFFVVNFSDEVMRLKEWGDLWFFCQRKCMYFQWIFLKPNALVRILPVYLKKNHQANEIFKEFYV